MPSASQPLYPSQGARIVAIRSRPLTLPLQMGAKGVHDGPGGSLTEKPDGKQHAIGPFDGAVGAFGMGDLQQRHSA